MAQLAAAGNCQRPDKREPPMSWIKTFFLLILRLFWNPAERRLRAFWRLIGQLLIAAGLLAGGVGVLAGLGLPVDSGVEPTAGGVDPGPAAIWAGLTTFAVFILSIWLAGRWLDRRAWPDFGFHFSRAWWEQLAFGLFLGGLLMSAIFAVEWALGWVRVTAVWRVVDGQTPFGLAILHPLALFIGVGIYEELFSRGYQLRNLAEGLRAGPVGPRAALWTAALLSSAVFGLLHAGNPNATWVSTLNIGLAGLLLAQGFLLTGELALPIGLHITWNFFQGNIFGLPVSGLPMVGGSVLRIEQAGPDWLTGGSFGPEGGALGLIALAAGFALTTAWVRLRLGRSAVQTRLAHYEPAGRLKVGADRPEIGEERL